jgi:hypothetical protein
MSGYPYHQRWFRNFDEHHHCWPNSHTYGASNIDDNKTCNDDGYIGKDMIIHWASTRYSQWFHSSCYWNVWVFSFSFWFIFNNLCMDNYRTSFVVFFNPFDASFSLLTTRIHNHATCASHIDSSTGCSTWSKFLLFSTHNN